MFAQTVEGIINYTIKNAVQPAIGFLIVLATVVYKDLEKDLGYFPLTLDYQERLSSSELVYN